MSKLSKQIDRKTAWMFITLTPLAIILFARVVFIGPLWLTIFNFILLIFAIKSVQREEIEIIKSDISLLINKIFKN